MRQIKRVTFNLAREVNKVYVEQDTCLSILSYHPCACGYEDFFMLTNKTLLKDVRDISNRVHVN
jgi:predicted thioredoxin/glutaredoxin